MANKQLKKEFGGFITKGLEIGRRHDVSIFKDLIRCCEKVLTNKPYEVDNTKIEKAFNQALVINNVKFKKESQNFLNYFKQEIAKKKETVAETVKISLEKIESLIQLYEKSPLDFSTEKMGLLTISEVPMSKYMESYA